MYGASVVVHLLLCVVSGSLSAIVENKINNGGVSSSGVLGSTLAILDVIGHSLGLSRVGASTRSVTRDTTAPVVADKSEKWLHDLRRSLMHDNYDYQSSGSESGLAIEDESSSELAGSIDYSSLEEDLSSIIIQDEHDSKRRDNDASVMFSDRESPIARQTFNAFGVKSSTSTDHQNLNGAKRFTPNDRQKLNGVKRFTLPDTRNLNGVKKITPPDNHNLNGVIRFTLPANHNLNGVKRFTPPDTHKLNGVKRLTPESPRFRDTGGRSAESVSLAPFTPRPVNKPRSRVSWLKERAIIEREFESRKRNLRENLYYLEDQLQPAYVRTHRPKGAPSEDDRSDSAKPPHQNYRTFRSQRKQARSFDDYDKLKTAASPPAVVDANGIRRYKVDKNVRFRSFGDATEASPKRNAINSFLERNGQAQKMTGLRFPWNDGRDGDLEGLDNVLREMEPRQKAINEDLERKDAEWQKNVKKIFGEMTI